MLVKGFGLVWRMVFDTVADYQDRKEHDYVR